MENVSGGQPIGAVLAMTIDIMPWAAILITSSGMLLAQGSLQHVYLILAPL